MHSRLIRSVVAASAVSFSCLACVTAHAQDAKAIKRAIEYRQGVFRVVGWDIGPMGAMAKGKIPFDAAEFQRRAARIAAMAPRALEGFGDGTSAGNGTKTRAKDSAWSDRADFEEKMQAFVDASAALAALPAGASEGELKAGLGDLGKSCKGCHDDHRSKEYR